mmetsp:Transcript_1239/g.3461  ORF Transcript_1239/g.3461 Transcript_1239/m.3461 type:complete len:201 (-) Transcript_1239:666-1268(-)
MRENIQRPSALWHQAPLFSEGPDQQRGGLPSRQCGDPRGCAGGGTPHQARAPARGGCRGDRGGSPEQALGGPDHLPETRDQQVGGAGREAGGEHALAKCAACGVAARTGLAAQALLSSWRAHVQCCFRRGWCGKPAADVLSVWLSRRHGRVLLCVPLRTGGLHDEVHPLGRYEPTGRDELFRGGRCLRPRQLRPLREHGR